MKKFLFTIFVLLVVPMMAYAQTVPAIILQPNVQTIAEQQQFYVDVMLNAQGGSFNGIQGTITFSNTNLRFVRTETGGSIVNYFINQPTVSGNTVTLSGIIIGGFSGLINPFDQTHKFPGEIVRLVFESTAPGIATINTSHVQVTNNDSTGTLENVPDSSLSLNVSNTVTPTVYNLPDRIPPTISAQIVQDAELYDGKYTLLFTATDKQSGIDHVVLREGNAPWITIQSPYVLHDQSRKSILSLRAYDVAGNVATITIQPIATSSIPVCIAIILVLSILITLYVIYKKRHQKK